MAAGTSPDLKVGCQEAVPARFTRVQSWEGQVRSGGRENRLIPRHCGRQGVITRHTNTCFLSLAGPLTTPQWLPSVALLPWGLAVPGVSELCGQLCLDDWGTLLGQMEQKIITWRQALLSHGLWSTLTFSSISKERTVEGAERGPGPPILPMPCQPV